jgi:bifunctional enzyme CysN/CysC
MAVTMLLEDELDISRGDLLCRPTNQPNASSRFEATLCWFDETSSLRTGAPYQLKHTTRWIAAEVEELRYRLDVDTLHRDLEVETLEVNDIGRVAIHTTSPLFFDEYRMNRSTGSFILVDPSTNLTVAAGMITGAGEPATAEVQAAPQPALVENITLHPSQLTREERWQALGTSGATIWMTGLSGSGKSTIARALAEDLADRGRRVTLLDGDEVRQHLSAELGFDAASRERNVERIGWVAARLAGHGGIAIAAPIAPFAASRARVRQLAEAEGAFLLVWVSTPLSVCEARDRKGLYARARTGEVADFTGISSPYEPPTDADIVIDTSVTGVEDAVATIRGALEARLGGGSASG